MGVLQKLEIAVEFALVDQHGAEALDRHIGQHEQFVEHDAVAPAQYALVIRFERGLRWRQRRPLRIVDEVKRKLRIAAETERVELLQSADRTVEHALAALAFHIVLQIAGHRGHHLDAVRRQKFGEIFLAWLLQDGEVATVHYLDAELARRRHQTAKIRIELGRAAGDVERCNALALDEVEHQVGDLRRHFLGPVRPGIDVAVEARLIAAIADIDLQGVEPAAADRREGHLIEQRPRVAHRNSRLPKQFATGAAPASPQIGVSLFSERGGDRGFDADAAESRQLDAGVAQIEPGDEPEQVDLDALDPTELHGGKTVQIELDAGAAVGAAGIKPVAEIAPDRVGW